MSGPAVEIEMDMGQGRRILLLAPQPFFRVTGTPINVLMMCRALTESGFEVHLVTLPYGEEVDLPNLVVHRVARLPFIKSVPVGFSAGKLLYNLLLLAVTARLLLRHRIAAVHAIEEAAFYAVPLARLLGVPGVIDLDSDLCQQLREHRSLLGRALAGPARRLRRFALRRAACVVSVADYMSKIAADESPRTPVFEINDIPIDAATRAPDAARMAAYRAELDLVDRRLIVYTGNFDRRQGLVELVRAMPGILACYPEVALLVVGGDADDVRALQALVDELGIEDAVRLIGSRPTEAMAELMGIAEVLVSPRLEPFATPLKIFSYMASGRPIVATNLPTHTRVVDDRTAILVTPTVYGLARGIAQALGDPAGAAARGARAREVVNERHNYPMFRRQMIEVYKTILAPAGTRSAATEQVNELVHG